MVNDMTYQCPHCGMFHSGVCPKIKSIEYFPNGSVKKVEYHKFSYCSPEKEEDDYFPDFWK